MLNAFKIVTGLLLLGGLTTGCTGSRLNASNTAITTVPKLINSEQSETAEYLWGGKILEVINKTGNTELTILSFPLGNNEKPKPSKASTGRYIAIYKGFLEPTDYRPGMLVTTLGTLKGSRKGQVSTTNYTYPVLLINNIKRHQPRKGTGLPFSIGIGVGIGL